MQCINNPWKCQDHRLRHDIYCCLLSQENVKSIKCSNLFKLLEERAGHSVFGENMAASNTRMVVVGAGPIGLRTAIEAQLLGAKVSVIEKRTSFTRFQLQYSIKKCISQDNILETMCFISGHGQ